MAINPKYVIIVIIPVLNVKTKIFFSENKKIKNKIKTLEYM